MRIHLRANKVSRSHTTLTVFVDGGNCGDLTLRNGEAKWFREVVARGAKGAGEFRETGEWHWLDEEPK